MAQLTIDESAATALGQEAPDEQRRGFWTAGAGVFVLWNAFTLAGALLGAALGDPRRFGLDGAAVGQLAEWRLGNRWLHVEVSRWYCGRRG